jgi:hypothetical protein
MLNKLKEMNGPISILYSFGDLAQGSFQGGFYVSIKQGSFLETFPNWESIVN